MVSSISGIFSWAVPVTWDFSEIDLNLQSADHRPCLSREYANFLFLSQNLHHELEQETVPFSVSTSGDSAYILSVLGLWSYYAGFKVGAYHCSVLGGMFMVCCDSEVVFSPVVSRLILPSGARPWLVREVLPSSHLELLTSAYVAWFIGRVVPVLSSFHHADPIVNIILVEWCFVFPVISWYFWVSRRSVFVYLTFLFPGHYPN